MSARARPRLDAARVRFVGSTHEVERLRSAPPERHVTFHEPANADVVWHVEVGDRIEQPDEFGPGGVVEQEVITLDQHQHVVRRHAHLIGDGPVEHPVECRASDNVGGRAEATYEVDEGVGGERLGRSLAAAQVAFVEHGIRQMESVHRHDRRTELAGQRRGSGRLAGAGRAGDPEQISGGSHRSFGDPCRQVIGFDCQRVAHPPSPFSSCCGSVRGRRRSTAPGRRDRCSTGPGSRRPCRGHPSCAVRRR